MVLWGEIVVNWLLAGAMALAVELTVLTLRQTAGHAGIKRW